MKPTFLKRSTPVPHKIRMKTNRRANSKSVTTTYDFRTVPAHNGNPGASVFLMNEAPGPSEAVTGIPSFGQQGANIFHALRKAGISWAAAHKKFCWPKDGPLDKSKRHQQKAAFLASRAEHITCSNSFPRWPKPANKPNGFCPPLEKDVASTSNINRIIGEILPTHRVILVCGAMAYYACLGKNLHSPATREGSALSVEELQMLNARLHSNFEYGWYMGHTRRWTLKAGQTQPALKLIAKHVGWTLETSAC